MRGDPKLVNLSNFVRFLYGFSPKPGEGDTPEVKQAIQAAQYLKRKATQPASGKEATLEPSNAVAAPKSASAEATAATKPSLEDAISILLENIEEDQRQQAAGMLGLLRWKQAPDWGSTRFKMFALGGFDATRKVAA
jgi:cytoskeletal protein RodZ